MARRRHQRRAGKTSTKPKRPAKHTPAKRTPAKKTPSSRKGFENNGWKRQGLQLLPTHDDIMKTELDDLPFIIQSYRTERHVPHQHALVKSCLKRILLEMNQDKGTDQEPHEEQVQVIRRLIYGKGDTLFVARTGFGKSLLFHAFSILTGKITIQIIPLDSLGEQQFKDLEQLPGVEPVLLNATTRITEPGLMAMIGAGKFSHILIGPEMATSGMFQKVLKVPKLAPRVGLVAIDECHLIQQWSRFRSAFTQLIVLRNTLREEAVWLGCSATISKEAESFILDRGGFREVGDSPYQTEVIRISVDRKDIFLIVKPIPRGMLQSWDALHFVLDNALSGESADPTKIRKCVIFVDNIQEVQAAREALIHILLGKTALASSQPYIPYGTEKYSARQIIKAYHSNVAKADKDLYVKEFQQLDSTIRIMITTNSLGMGVNIPDIQDVICWKFPIDYDVCDTWQKGGRGGRGPGRTSRMILLLPYWAFDYLGVEPNKNNKKQMPKKKRPQSDNFILVNPDQPSQPRKARSRRGSQLSVSMIYDEVSDAESIQSNSAVSGQKVWNQAEMKLRAGLNSVWKMIINGPCHRNPFLEFFCESKSTVEKDNCCSRCNPSCFIHNIQSLTAPVNISIRQPRGASRARFALEWITEWATNKAESELNDDEFCSPMPPDAFLVKECRWEIANLFSDPNVFDNTEGSGFLDELESTLPEKTSIVLKWKYWKIKKFREELFSYLRSLPSKIQEQLDAIRDEKERSKQLELGAALRDQAIESLPVSDQAKQDTLAIQVIRRTAAQTTQSQLAKEGRSSKDQELLTPYTFLPTPISSILPSSSQSSFSLFSQFSSQPDITPTQTASPAVKDTPQTQEIASSESTPSKKRHGSTLDTALGKRPVLAPRDNNKQLQFRRDRGEGKRIIKPTPRAESMFAGTEDQ